MNKWGIPAMRGHGRTVLAVAIDAIGSGIYFPIIVLYFAVTTDLSLVTIGGALSLGQLIALPSGIWAGTIVDRWGVRPVLIASNVIQCVGMAAYLWSDSFASITIWTLVLAIGRTAFWGSYGNLVAAISAPGERELWFGFLGALRNLSFVVGGLAAFVVLAFDTELAFRSAIALNAASFALAGLLLTSVTTPVPDSAEKGGGGWAVVLRDRPFVGGMVTQASYCLSVMVLNFAIPVYLVEVLDLAGWLAPVVFVLNTALIGLGQSPTVARLTGSVRWRVIVAGHLFFAAGYGAFAVLAAVPRDQALWSITVVVLAGVLYTFGEILGGPVMTAMWVEHAPEELRGRYLSVVQLTWGVATAGAPVLFALLLERTGVWTWWVMAATSVVGAVAAVVTSRTMPAARALITNAAH